MRPAECITSQQQMPVHFLNPVTSATGVGCIQWSCQDQYDVVSTGFAGGGGGLAEYTFVSKQQTTLLWTLALEAAKGECSIVQS